MPDVINLDSEPECYILSDLDKEDAPKPPRQVAKQLALINSGSRQQQRPPLSSKISGSNLKRYIPSLEQLKLSALLFNTSYLMEEVGIATKDKPLKSHVIYLHNDTTDPIQLSKRLYGPLGGLVTVLSQYDVIHANEYRSWEGLIRTEARLIMSKEAFVSAVYHGLVPVSKIFLLIVENIANFGLVEKAFEEMSTPLESMPLIVGVDLKDSLNRPSPALIYRSTPLRKTAGLPKPFKYTEIYPELKRVEGVYQMLHDSLGDWAATQYLSRALNKLKAEIHKERMLSDEQYLEVGCYLRNMTVALAGRPAIEPQKLGAMLTSTPVHNLWLNLQARLEKGLDICLVVLVADADTAMCLAELLRNLSFCAPQLKVTCACIRPSSERGQNIVVSTFDEFKPFRGLKYAIYAFGCFPSLLSYLRIRTRICPSILKFMILTHADDPLIPHIKAIEEQGLVHRIRLYKKLPPSPDPTRACKVTPAGAVLTFTSAKMFLAEYSNVFSNITKAHPVYYGYHVEQKNGSYTCKFTFSPCFGIASFYGPPQASKLLAKQVAAWKACICLKQAGILDDHLLPLSKGSSALIAINADVDVDSVTEIMLSTKVADFWDLPPTQPNQLYLNLIQVDQIGYRPFAIATHNPLPKHLLSITLTFKHAYVDANFSPNDQTITVSDSQLNLLLSFTLYALSLALERRIDHTMPYFFVPLKGTAVDWESIARIQEQEISLSDNAICHDAKYQFYHFSKPNSLTPLEIPRDYILFESTTPTKPMHVPQREMDHVPIPMALDVLHSVCLFPSILKRLEDNLIALEVKEILEMDKLQDDLLMEALTLESAELAFNLHRLQFLGESFLNLMMGFVSLLNHENIKFCYNRHAPNNCLSDLVYNLDIHRRLIGASLNRPWIPPTFSRFNQENHFQCTAKDVADVLGAILGAALLSGGEAMGIQCLISFGLWPRGVNSWPRILETLKLNLPLSLLKSLNLLMWISSRSSLGSALDTRQMPLECCFIQELSPTTSASLESCCSNTWLLAF
ncbi:Dicer-like protein 1 [Entomophthora muscae]|uniref:Dicer-like protein 1 n=1 Tax=Entomophthora muscae TaxID=34485 RepID=A0ACC2SM98_9FUNG|nr:Dicer-like protein 1 [Entomophthora muscae]